MKYVAACSFGKDSIATVILAKEHNEPLDEVMPPFFFRRRRNENAQTLNVDGSP